MTDLTIDQPAAVAYELALLDYRIRYSREDRDYTCYVTIDGVEQTIGSRASCHEAEMHCREYLYGHYADTHTPGKARSGESGEIN